MIIRYIALLIVVCVAILAIWSLLIKPTTPPVVENQPVASPWANLYPIEDETVVQELNFTTKNTFLDFTAKSAGTIGWQTFTKDAKQIPSTVGLPALNVKIPLQMEPVLNTADWGIHSCKTTATKPKFVLRLLFALGTQGELITYTEKQELFKKWEQTMLSDVQAIVFPKEFYSTGLSIDGEFTDNNSYGLPGVRQSMVVSGTNPVSEFGYIIVGDHVLIGNDMDCMNYIAVDILGLVP